VTVCGLCEGLCVCLERTLVGDLCGLCEGLCVSGEDISG